MGKHLVMVGGGHAHLTTLKQLRHFTSRGHQVTLISPVPFHDYSGMGPGLLSGRYRLSEVRFNIARMTTIRGGRFIEAAATGINPGKRELLLSDGTTLDYDVVSFNNGSEVTMSIPVKAVGHSIFPVKPINNLYHARQRIKSAATENNKPLRLLVIGGGPSGCEITGNLQALSFHEKINSVITQVTGSHLLKSYPSRIRNRVRTLLATKELQLIEGTYVKQLRSNTAVLDDDRSIDFDFAFIASGITPAAPFSIAGLADESNGLIVNEYLQAPTNPEIFGGGDCITFQPRHLDKVGVYAVRQGQVLRKNLLAALEQTALTEFLPQSRYLQILNLGLGRAVATSHGISWSGFSALWLKSYLDHNFMKKFQEFG